MNLLGGLILLFLVSSTAADPEPSGTRCPTSMRPCSNDICLPDKWFCDGDADCPNGEDEISCGPPPQPVPWNSQPPPQPQPWVPQPDPVPNHWAPQPDPVRNPWDPLPDSVSNPWAPQPDPVPNPWAPQPDSVSNPWAPQPDPLPNPWVPQPDPDPLIPGVCPPNSFRCDAGCLSLSFRCNGIRDCSDGVDELGCPQRVTSSVQSACSQDEVQCYTGSCIKITQICDGRVDCDHEEDEFACAFIKNKEFAFSCIEKCLGIPRQNCTTSNPFTPTTTTIPPPTTTLIPYCDAGYTLIHDRCIKVIVYPPKDWIWAKQNCEAANSVLVEIDDGDFFLGLQSFLNQSQYEPYSYWTGATDSGREGFWTWSNSSTPVHRGAPLWTIAREGDKYIQQPAGGIEENCGLLEDCPFQYLNDVSCAKLYPYVCQRSPNLRRY